MKLSVIFLLLVVCAALMGISYIPGSIAGNKKNADDFYFIMRVHNYNFSAIIMMVLAEMVAQRYSHIVVGIQLFFLVLAQHIKQTDTEKYFRMYSCEEYDLAIFVLEWTFFKYLLIAATSVSLLLLLELFAFVRQKMALRGG